MKRGPAFGHFAAQLLMIEQMKYELKIKEREISPICVVLTRYECLQEKDRDVYLRFSFSRFLISSVELNEAIVLLSLSFYFIVTFTFFDLLNLLSNVILLLWLSHINISNIQTEQLV